ncbi:MAG: hypothetical protein E7648_05525 [Ruminococcaceae bacterium]|nr:hypothetical protein [Oscillospiraceae bacterium]
MKILVDAKMSNKVRDSLLSYGEVVSLPKWKGLPEPVSSHPDMLFYPLPDGKILVGRDYYNENRGFFDALGCDFVLDEKTPSGEYPFDVRFDCLGVNGVLYGKDGFVSERIAEQYMSFVSVNQGYTRCSVAMLSEKCAVTADRGIASALSKNGIDVLTIRPGHIELKGYDSGFIGGAGALLSDGVYGFFGDLLSHPDGEMIAEFAARHKIKAVSLSDEPLSDNGGLLILREAYLR